MPPYAGDMIQNPSSTLICVYSRSGHSRRVAEYLGNLLGIAPFEVRTGRYSWPVLGWIAAGRDGMQGRAVPLDPPLDLADGRRIVLIGPVWAGGPAAPLNTLIDTLAKGDQEVAAILTCGDPKEQAAPLDKMAERLGRSLTAGLVVSNAAQDSPAGQARIRAFAEALQAQAPST